MAVGAPSLHFNTSRVRLEARGSREAAVPGQVFQYLKGAIRGWQATSPQCGKTQDFNTSRVRLEAITAAVNSRGSRYFNTSRVRLEVGFPSSRSLANFISIPQGCD